MVKNGDGITTRYTPQTVRFYCFKDNTKISLFSSLTNSQLTNSDLVTILEGDEGDVVEYQIPTSPDPTQTNIGKFVLMNL